MTDEKIKNSRELEFAVFCIENVAAKLDVDAERVYQAFTEKSNILNGYIVPEYDISFACARIASSSYGKSPSPVSHTSFARLKTAHAFGQPA